MLALMQILDTTLHFTVNQFNSLVSRAHTSLWEARWRAMMPHLVILLLSLRKPVKRHAWRALTNPVTGRIPALTPMKGTMFLNPDNPTNKPVNLEHTSL